MKQKTIIVVRNAFLLGAFSSAVFAQSAGANAACALPGNAWLSPAAALDQKLPHWLCFTGEERIRAEGVTGSGFQADHGDGYMLNRFRFDMKLLPSSWLSFEFQTQDARAFWKEQHPYAPPYQDTWDLRLAYVQLGNLEKYHAAFRAGRQELAFGDERLIGSSNFTNVARSFDGYRAMFQQGKFRLDAFAASVVVLVDGQVGGHTPGNYIDGLYGQLQDVIPHATLQPYFLWRRSPSQKMENGGLANEHFGTTGFRWVGKLPLGFDYNSEMAIQRGSLGADRIASWASHLSMGYKIPRFAAPATRYIVEYNFASGDGNAKDGVHGTFDQLYATSHDKLDLADQVGWKNIQHFRTGPEFIISRRFASSIKYSDYWLANAHDALYNASGAVVTRSANGSAGRWVGQEFDGTLVYSLTRTSQLGGGFGYLLPGTFLKLTTPGRAYSYPYLYYSTSF